MTESESARCSRPGGGVQFGTATGTATSRTVTESPDAAAPLPTSRTGAESDPSSPVESAVTEVRSISRTATAVASSGSERIRTDPRSRASAALGGIL
ncbi:hypothetical protein ACFQS5_06325 [Salinirubellus sp. GCM10025899]|uniref:hypothetical protein n=1 Tax=Salinirubellus sp. GCM10025899 TaxID=3252689 RepID=UPI0036086426